MGVEQEKTSGNKAIPLLQGLYPLALLLLLLLLIPFFRRWFFASGLRWAYVFFFSLSLSYALTPVARWVALRYRILDVPAGRKIHGKSTPLLGGAAILISFCCSLSANMILEREMLLLLFGGLAVAFSGLLDDLRGIAPVLKLLIQISVTLILIYNGIILDLFAPETTWGYMANLILTVIWIVGITNAMNFFDGMDGLATGLSIIIALFIGVVSFQTRQPVMGWVSVAILGSCLGFFPYNFRLKKPAAIFLGDTGSMFLGFVLASLAVQGYWADQKPIVSFATPILIFWILIFDMVYITIERAVTGKVRNLKEWIDYVGTDHLHHRLYALLRDKRKAVLTIFLFSAALGLGSLALRNARTIDAIILVFQAFLIVLIFSVLEYAGRKR